MHTAPLSPVREDQRLITVDVLRGIALLGILIMNVAVFSLPNRYSETFRSNPESLNFWIYTLKLIFFEGKMRAIFSMVFGVGILLFMRKTDDGATEKSVLFLFFRRMGWLILFGLVDAYVILWEGDILYLYGVVGMIAVWFRKLKPVYLALGFPLVAILEFVSGTFFYQNIRNQHLDYVRVVNELKVSSDTTVEQKAVLAAWRDNELTFLPNRDDIEENTKKMKSGYASVAETIRKFARSYQTTFLYFAIWDPLALMLLGMALYKTGFFTFGWPTQKYRRAMLWGYGIGFPVVFIESYFSFIHFPDFEHTIAYMDAHPIPWFNLLYPVQRIALSTAHCCLIMIWIQKGFFRAVFQ